jgi:hypothetical protein
MPRAKSPRRLWNPQPSISVYKPMRSSSAGRSLTPVMYGLFDAETTVQESNSAVQCRMPATNPTGLSWHLWEHRPGRRAYCVSSGSPATHNTA